MQGRRRGWALGTASSVLVAVLAASATFAGGARASPEATTTGVSVSPSQFPIQHIVVLVMENRAYDNYFGTYCLVNGTYCPDNATGIPSGLCIPLNPANDSAGCVTPFNYTAANLTMPKHGLPHDYTSSMAAYNNGSMNNFYLAEGSGLTPFGHYNGSTIPIYWDIAQEYGLGDHFFSSVFSYSLPNHWYLLAGQSPQIAVYKVPSGPKTAGMPLSSTAVTYLNESNQTPSAEDLLMNATGVSWKYYDYSLPSYGRAIQARGGPDTVGAYDFWNPQAAKAESYTTALASHFVNRSSFFTDAKRGTLPNASWIIPAFTQSDHPPANVTKGESFVARVVNSIERSPEWKSTALFITWDDYGGFWDQMTPPSVDSLGLSFRVPLLVVSPYTPVGYVSHSAESFESLLGFIEWRFSLGCLTVRDCNAQIPLEYFDLNMTARAAVIFPTSPSMATYPMSVAQSPAGVPMGWPPATYTNSTFNYTSYDGPTPAADLAYVTPGD